MPRLVLAIVLLAAILCQAILLPDIIALQVRPNLVLILILLWTILRGPREGALWAFATGLVLDLMTLSPIGAHALALLGVVVIGRFSRTPRFHLHLVLPMLAAFGATLIHDTILLLAQGAGSGLLRVLLNLSLLAGLLNTIVTPALMLLTNRLHQWLEGQEASFGRPSARPEASRMGRR